MGTVETCCGTGWWRGGDCAGAGAKGARCMAMSVDQGGKKRKKRRKEMGILLKCSAGCDSGVEGGRAAGRAAQRTICSIWSFVTTWPECRPPKVRRAARHSPQRRFSMPQSQTQLDDWIAQDVGRIRDYHDVGRGAVVQVLRAGRRPCRQQPYQRCFHRREGPTSGCNGRRRFACV